MQLNAQEGLEGNPAGKTIKNVSRAFAVLTVPLTASFAKVGYATNLFIMVHSLFVLFMHDDKSSKSVYVEVSDAPLLPTSFSPFFLFFLFFSWWSPNCSQILFLVELLDT